MGSASLFHIAARLRRDARGGVAILMALGVPVLMGAAGTALDLSRWQNEKSRAQSAADSAALATVREISAIGSDPKRLTAVAEQIAKSNIGSLADRIRVTSSMPQGSKNALQVVIELTSKPGMSKLLGIGEATISVRSTAQLVGSTRICMIALDPKKGKTIEVSKQAKVTAPQCSVFANSTDKQALSAKDTSLLTAHVICSSGGVEGSSFNFNPAPKVDCPPIPDPLSGRPAPVSSHCDHNDRVVDSGSVVLKPGVYCKGLKITKDAKVTLDPGVYIIKDGKLIVDHTASMTGVNVGFFLTGGNAQFEFDKGTTISLTAPKDGALAGLLFYEDRNAAHGHKHAILSNNAHTLLGTVYLPRGYLHIDANAPISNKAAYTIIVASRVEMISGPELVLNANYGATDVPVPAGVGPVSGYAALAK